MTREQLLEQAKPILFSTPMVQSLDIKTATRRVMNPQPQAWSSCDHTAGFFDMGGNEWACRKCGYGVLEHPRNGKHSIFRAKYKPGDILWVREKWQYGTDLFGEFPQLMYAADFNDDELADARKKGFRWKPSIHMPKAAARLFLRVTGVRVEMLQDISVADCIAEGIDCDNDINNPDPATHESIKNWNLSYAQFLYKELWDCLNKKRGFGWDTNPWVWGIEFERIAGEGLR